MTGKLIKYEFRSIVKLMGIIWVALPAMAVIISIFDWLSPEGNFDNNFILDMLNLATMFLYGAIFVALIVVTMLIVIMRFYKGLLRDEGYLMHTLPVKTWQLITAKGVVAVLVEFISMVVAILSILLLAVPNGGLTYFGDFLRGVGKAIGEEPMILLIAVETLILILAACAASNYKVYASLSIGQLAKKHRIVCSVAAYLGLGVIMMIVMTVVGHILDGDVFDFIFDTVNGWFSGMEVTSIVAWVIFAAILAQVILVAIYHVISEQILRRKLNLE